MLPLVVRPALRVAVSFVTMLVIGGDWRAAADDLESIRGDVERALPGTTLERLSVMPEVRFRARERGPTVYRERVNGVVLIASTNTVGTGVLVSPGGDLITNDHIVRAAHKAQGEEWVAVWFKPPAGGRPAKTAFLLGKVVQKDPRRDLARIRLMQPPPQTATAVPLASVMPDIGQDVFTIGHPRTHLWSLTHGVVSQIRPNYEWKYEDGIPRSATAIQTQAPVSPGNSGGPLLNDGGAIVGIVVGTASDSQGMYFAVSVQHVRELLMR